MNFLFLLISFALKKLTYSDLLSSGVLINLLEFVERLMNTPQVQRSLFRFRGSRNNINSEISLERVQSAHLALHLLCSRVMHSGNSSENTLFSLC